LRATVYLIVRTPVPGLAASVLAIAFSGDATIGLILVAPIMAAYSALNVATAGTERRAVTLIGRPEIPDPHLTDDADMALAALRRRLREPATGREIAHGIARLVLVLVDLFLLLGWVLAAALLSAPVLIGGGPVAAGPVTIRTTAGAWGGSAVGLALLLLTAYAVTGAAIGHAWLARVLLGPRGDELRAQITDLTRSRLRLIDAFDVERRRIERDLHDGAQQQLTALAMTLDLARIELEETSHPAADLVAQAHRQAVSTIGELRELIHGIHPPVLTEVGLGEAVRVLADRAGLPVRTSVQLPDRPPVSVETAAYFVVAEALANAVKHSSASVVTIDLRMLDGTLVAVIKDDGVGGATQDGGTGLAGLGDRVAAVAGRLTLSSPEGGPTVLKAEIPCHPRTDADEHT
jgi:signal transduction histidine kinase